MKAKIIAELCQNHNGEKPILEEMIVRAQENGATYAKIQGLYSDELSIRNEFEKRYEKNSNEPYFYRPVESERNRLRGLELTPELESWFVIRCLEQGIIPMTTVFSHSGVNRARDAGFRAIKIASYDCGSVPLIERCAQFANELVVSTGATYWEEIRNTAEVLRKFKNNTEITFLHATTIYPTPSKSINIKKILWLKSLGFNVGYSDHTNIQDMDFLASKSALILGAKIIERHFTILDKDKTKDGVVSINPSELRRLSRIIEVFEKSELSQEFNESIMNQISNLLSHEMSLDLSATEIRNRNYYRGRVASFFDGHQIFAWENWPND